MATSSILGGDRAPSRAPGRDIDLLGPSDSSDTGSDVQAEGGFQALDEGEIGAERVDLGGDSDAGGTGERGPAVRDSAIIDGADIVPDSIQSVAGSDDTETLSDEELEELAADDHPDSDDDLDEDDGSDEDLDARDRGNDLSDLEKRDG